MDFIFKNKKLKRVLFAFVISSIGVGLSFLFRPQRPQSEYAQKKELTAIILAANNEVKKKFQQEIIWEDAPTGAPLYKGEIIKTGESSTTLIRFLKSGTKIELEPNTVVVLDDLNNEATIDVIGGSLLIKGQSKNARMKIKSGKKILDIEDAEMSVSVEKSGKMGVEIYKGAATAIINGRSIELTRQTSGEIDDKKFTEDELFFRDVRPTYDETVYISSSKEQDLINITWAKLVPGYKIVLERGIQRNQLEIVRDFIVDGTTGLLTIPFSIGTFYWRLKAIPESDKNKVYYSKTSKIMVRLKSRPILVSPYNDEQVYLKDRTQAINFLWNTPVKLEQQILEIAKDELFKNKIHQKFLENTNNYQVNIIEKEGNYFWRVKGVLEKSSSTISSNVGHFSVFYGEIEVPPTLIAPEHDQVYQLGDNSAYNVDLKWKQLTNVKNYKVTFRGLGEKSDLQVTKEVKKNNFYIKGLVPGEYEWFVVGVLNSGKQTPNSQNRRFSIVSAKNIPWTDFKKIYEYSDEKPTVSLQWAKIKDVKWEIVMSQDPSLKLSNIIRPYENKWSFIPASDGEYFVKILAYTMDEILVGKSKTEKFKVFKRPLLPAPEFLAEIPSPIISDKRGIVKVGVYPVEKSQAYLLEFSNDKGRMVRQQVSEKPIIKVESLMPGTYFVTVQAIDKIGRSGLKSQKRQLIVPEGSSIRPPVIKKIKIK